jgi:hypothetical protein
MYRMHMLQTFFAVQNLLPRIIRLEGKANNIAALDCLQNLLLEFPLDLLSLVIRC